MIGRWGCGDMGKSLEFVFSGLGAVLLCSHIDMVHACIFILLVDS